LNLKLYFNDLMSYFLVIKFNFYFANLCALLLFLGPIAKSAQFPLHVWLPDAMEGPTPISALIHAATMVAAGIFLIARLFPLFQALPYIMNIISWIGAITALLGATIALATKKILKRFSLFHNVSIRLYDDSFRYWLVSSWLISFNYTCLFKSFIISWLWFCYSFYGIYGWIFS